MNKVYTWSMSRTVQTYSVNVYCCIKILNHNLLMSTNYLQQPILNHVYHVLILALNMSKLHWWQILALNVCSIKFALKHNNLEFLTQDVMSNEWIQEGVNKHTIWPLGNPFLILILFSSLHSIFFFTLLCYRIYFVYLCVYLVWCFTTFMF